MGKLTLKDLLIANIISEYKESLEIRANALEEVLREKLAKKTRFELLSSKVFVELTARIVPKMK